MSTEALLLKYFFFLYEIGMHGDYCPRGKKKKKEKPYIKAN